MFCFVFSNLGCHFSGLGLLLHLFQSYIRSGFKILLISSSYLYKIFGSIPPTDAMIKEDLLLGNETICHSFLTGTFMCEVFHHVLHAEQGPKHFSKYQDYVRLHGKQSLFLCFIVNIGIYWLFRTIKARTKTAVYLPERSQLSGSAHADLKNTSMVSKHHFFHSSPRKTLRILTYLCRKIEPDLFLL